MAFDLHLGKDFLDFALRVDHESGPLDAHVLLAVHTFFFPDPVRLGRLVLRVAQQRKRQIELRLEFGLSVRLVGGDADNDRIGMGELFGGIAELAGFLGAAWGISLRVEIQHYVLAFEGRKMEMVSGIGVEGYCRGWVAFFWVRHMGREMSGSSGELQIERTNPTNVVFTKRTSLI